MPPLNTIVQIHFSIADLYKLIYVDCVVEDDTDVFPIEIKTSQTFNDSFLKNIVLWNTLRSPKKGVELKSFVIYGGKQEMQYKSTMVKSVYSF